LITIFSVIEVHGSVTDLTINLIDFKFVEEWNGALNGMALNTIKGLHGDNIERKLKPD